LIGASEVVTNAGGNSIFLAQVFFKVCQGMIKTKQKRPMLLISTNVLEFCHKGSQHQTSFCRKWVIVAFFKIFRLKVTLSKKSGECKQTSKNNHTHWSKYVWYWFLTKWKLTKRSFRTAPKIKCGVFLNPTFIFSN
jgi:hypothetical protein